MSTAPETTVRRATRDDARAISRIHVDVWRSTYAGILPETVLAQQSYDARERQWQAWLEDAGDAHRVFIASESLTAVGFASCGANRTRCERVPGEMSALYVADDARGRGVGVALFASAAADLNARKLNPFLLWVLAGNERAIAFYERLGGRRIARKDAFFGETPVEEFAYFFS